MKNRLKIKDVRFRAFEICWVRGNMFKIKGFRLYFDNLNPFVILKSNTMKNTWLR